MKYKVGDKVAVLATITQVDENGDCLPYHAYFDNNIGIWFSSDCLINPLSERNRTKAFQMHYKRVKGELEVMARELDQQKEREEALREYIAKEQDDYANLAGKYSKVIQENCAIVCDLEKWKRKAKAWKFSWFILLVALVITSTINLIGVL